MLHKLTHKKMNYKITILLIIALLSVSTSPIVARFIDNVPAVSISFWRMFIGSCLLWIFSIFKNQGSIKDKKNYYRTFFAGILLEIVLILEDITQFFLVCLIGR